MVTKTCTNCEQQRLRASDGLDGTELSPTWFGCTQAAVKKHREAVKYGKLAERLGAVASRIDTVSKMAVRQLLQVTIQRCCCAAPC